MRKLLGCIMIVAGAGRACWAQGLYDQLNFRNAERAGFGIYGASVFYGYSKYGETTTGQPPATSNYGGSFSVGWQHHRPKTDASILYNGTYLGLTKYSEFNAYNQSLSLSAHRQLGPKWTGTLSASGQDYSLSASLFQPSALSVTSQMTTSFNDFAAAFGLGQFSTGQVQSLFQGSFLESAIRSGLLGGRVLSYGGQASLGYALSRSVSFSFGGTAAGGRRVGDSQFAVQPNYAMPLAYGGDFGIQMTHSFSPRTQVSLDIHDTYTRSVYQEASISTVTGSFGRKMGSRWFLRMYGGGAYSYFLHQTTGQPKALQAVGGGSLGFQMLTHTLTATYDRSALAAYGYSVGTNTNLMASWSWHRVGSKLSLFSSFGQQQQRNTGYLSISGWQAAAGFSESLSAQTSISLQYVYLDTTGRYPGGLFHIATNSARVSLNWSPHPALR